MKDFGMLICLWEFDNKEPYWTLHDSYCVDEHGNLIGDHKYDCEEPWLKFMTRVCDQHEVDFISNRAVTCWSFAGGVEIKQLTVDSPVVFAGQIQPKNDDYAFINGYWHLLSETEKTAKKLFIKGD